MKKISTLIATLLIAVVAFAGNPLTVQRTFTANDAARRVATMPMTKVDTPLNAPVKNIENAIVTDGETLPDVTGTYLTVFTFNNSANCSEAEIVPGTEPNHYIIKHLFFSDALDIPCEVKNVTYKIDAAGNTVTLPTLVIAGNGQTPIFDFGDGTICHLYLADTENLYSDDIEFIISKGQLYLAYSGVEIFYGYKDEATGKFRGNSFTNVALCEPNATMTTEEYNSTSQTWEPFTCPLYTELAEDNATLYVGNFDGYGSLITMELDAKNLTGSFVEQKITTARLNDGSTVDCFPTNYFDAEGKVTDYVMDFTFDENDAKNSVALMEGMWEVACEAGWLTLAQNGNITFNYNVFNPESVGVSNIAVDNTNAPVEFYNLQGIRVENPAAGNIYIRRQGTTATKVLVK